MSTKFDKLLNELYEEHTLQSPILLERQLLEEGAIDKIAAFVGTTPDKVEAWYKEVGLPVLVAALGLGTYFGIKSFSEPVQAKADDNKTEIKRDLGLDDDWYPGMPSACEVDDLQGAGPEGMRTIERLPGQGMRLGDETGSEISHPSDGPGNPVMNKPPKKYDNPYGPGGLAPGPKIKRKPKVRSRDIPLPKKPRPDFYDDDL